MLVSLIKFTLAFHISIANRLTFATNVSLNCNTSDIYIFISRNIHIKFDLNVINNANAEYNKKRMYESLFLSSFAPEKITDHYREANRGRQKPYLMRWSVSPIRDSADCYTASSLYRLVMDMKQAV